MKINVVQGKFVDDFTFESISNFISKLFSKSLLKFEFYSTDYFMLNDFEEGEYRDEILKKIKLEEEIVNSGQGQTFDYIFNEVRSKRNLLDINPSELVIYLTGEKNERNFLGWIDEGMKNCFINTMIWKHIYDDETNVIYPISYEIIGWSLRTLMFENPEELIDNIHFEKTTCLMSLNVSKLFAFLNKTPVRAPLPSPTAIAAGVAKPMAHGQEITKTAMDLNILSLNPISVKK